MPYVPTNPVLPNDPEERRRVYENHRRLLQHFITDTDVNQLLTLASGRMLHHLANPRR